MMCTNCYEEIEDEAAVGCPRCGWVEFQADDPGPDMTMEPDPEYSGDPDHSWVGDKNE